MENEEYLGLEGKRIMVCSCVVFETLAIPYMKGRSVQGFVITDEYEKRPRNPCGRDSLLKNNQINGAIIDVYNNGGKEYNDLSFELACFCVPRFPTVVLEKWSMRTWDYAGMERYRKLEELGGLMVGYQGIIKYILNESLTALDAEFTRRVLAG